MVTTERKDSHTSATELGDGLIRLPDVTVNDALSNGVALLGAVFLVVVPAICRKYPCPICKCLRG